MGIFSSFFGYVFGSPEKKYSSEEHQLSEYDLKRLINHEHIQVLDNHQAEIIRAAILARRRGDGRISERQIYDVLRPMVNTNQISRYDRDAVMKTMKIFFGERRRQHV